MTPAAQTIINDLKSHMERAFTQLVDLVQEEAIKDLMSRLYPAKSLIPNAPQLDAPIKEVVRRRAVPQYANPEDDPNYGQMGSLAHSSEGSQGGIVSDIIDEETPF